MHRQQLTFVILIVCIVFLAACGKQPEDAGGTATYESQVSAAVQATLTALPTATVAETASPYPTYTPFPTATPYPTLTPPATYTPYPTLTPPPTETAAPTETATPVPTTAPVVVVTPAPTVPALTAAEEIALLKDEVETTRTNMLLYSGAMVQRRYFGGGYRPIQCANIVYFFDQVNTPLSMDIDGKDQAFQVAYNLYTAALDQFITGTVSWTDECRAFIAAGGVEKELEGLERSLIVLEITEAVEKLDEAFNILNDLLNRE